MQECKTKYSVFAMLTGSFCIGSSMERCCPAVRSLIYLSCTKQKGLPTSRPFVCRYYSNGRKERRPSLL